MRWIVCRDIHDLAEVICRNANAFQIRTNDLAKGIRRLNHRTGFWIFAGIIFGSLIEAEVKDQKKRIEELEKKVEELRTAYIKGEDKMR